VPGLPVLEKGNKMTRSEALKILEEVYQSIASHSGMVPPDDAKIDDWSYDLVQVINAIVDGETTWEDEDDER
jgi:hypothetical protein